VSAPGARTGWVARVADIVLPCAVLAVVGWLDYVTGPRLAFSPVYFLVLAALALRHPRDAALFFSLFASGVFLVVDLLTVPRNASTIYPYWRAAGQLLSFSVVSFTITQLVEDRRSLVDSRTSLPKHAAELQAVNEKLVATLEELSASKERALEDVLRQHVREVSRLRETLGEVMHGLAQLATRARPPGPEDPLPAADEGDGEEDLNGAEAVRG